MTSRPLSHPGAPSQPEMEPSGALYAVLLRLYSSVHAVLREFHGSAIPELMSAVDFHHKSILCEEEMVSAMKSISISTPKIATALLPPRPSTYAQAALGKPAQPAPQRSGSTQTARAGNLRRAHSVRPAAGPRGEQICAKSASARRDKSDKKKTGPPLVTARQGLLRSSRASVGVSMKLLIPKLAAWRKLSDSQLSAQLGTLYVSAPLSRAFARYAIRYSELFHVSGQANNCFLRAFCVSLCGCVITDEQAGMLRCLIEAVLKRVCVLDREDAQLIYPAPLGSASDAISLLRKPGGHNNLLETAMIYALVLVFPHIAIRIDELKVSSKGNVLSEETIGLRAILRSPALVAISPAVDADTQPSLPSGVLVSNTFRHDNHYSAVVEVAGGFRNVPGDSLLCKPKISLTELIARVHALLNEEDLIDIELMRQLDVVKAANAFFADSADDNPLQRSCDVMRAVNAAKSHFPELHKVIDALYINESVATDSASSRVIAAAHVPVLSNVSTHRVQRTLGSVAVRGTPARVTPEVCTCTAPAGAHDLTCGRAMKPRIVSSSALARSRTATSLAVPTAPTLSVSSTAGHHQAAKPPIVSNVILRGGSIAAPSAALSMNTSVSPALVLVDPNIVAELSTNKALQAESSSAQTASVASAPGTCDNHDTATTAPPDAEVDHCHVCAAAGSVAHPPPDSTCSNAKCGNRFHHHCYVPERHADPSLCRDCAIKNRAALNLPSRAAALPSNKKMSGLGKAAKQSRSGSRQSNLMSPSQQRGCEIPPKQAANGSPNTTAPQRLGVAGAPQMPAVSAPPEHLTASIASPAPLLSSSAEPLAALPNKSKLAAPAQCIEVPRRLQNTSGVYRDDNEIPLSYEDPDHIDDDAVQRDGDIAEAAADDLCSASTRPSVPSSSTSGVAACDMSSADSRADTAIPAMSGHSVANSSVSSSNVAVSSIAAVPTASAPEVATTAVDNTSTAAVPSATSEVSSMDSAALALPARGTLKRGLHAAQLIQSESSLEASPVSGRTRGGLARKVESMNTQSLAAASAVHSVANSAVSAAVGNNVAATSIPAASDGAPANSAPPADSLAKRRRRGGGGSE